MPFLDTLQHSWNAFIGRDPTLAQRAETGPSYYYRPDRMRFTKGHEKSIVTSVYNRLAVDVAQLDFCHCQLDMNDRYMETRTSGLNYCLTTEANLDQTGRAFIQDACQSMFDEGVVALVPIETDDNVLITNSFELLSIRTGRIVEWYPKHIRVSVYNERTGRKQELVMPKKKVAIIENPFYAVMNEPNSTMQRLIRKLNQLDVIDEQSSSGKLDLLIQLPYAIKTDARRFQAKERIKDLESQLNGSKFGVAYTDSTEKIVQLNRGLENNIMSEVQYLTDMLYSQLGLTTAIMNGTASDSEMQNYYVRTIEPIATAIVEEMRRKFLTKTARTQKQSVMFFRNPLKLVSVNQAADIADKFTRNEIISTNEMRQSIGFKPVQDEMADQLRNKNIPPAEGQQFATTGGDYGEYEDYEDVPPEEAGDEYYEE